MVKLQKLYVCLCYLVFAGLFPEVRTMGQVSQMRGSQTRIVTNMQSGTAYTILGTDCGKLISFSNAAPVAVTIPPAGPTGLAAGCWMDIQNMGPGAVTLTPTTSPIDQAASVNLALNQGLRLVSNGSAYLTERGQSSGTGTVTNSSGALVSSAIAIGNGGADIETPVAAATMDTNGNISLPGSLTANTSCTTCAGAIDLVAGTDPGAGPLASTFSWLAPSSIPTAYRWKVPSADAAGAIASDGAATPGTLSIVPFSGTGSIARTVSPVITTASLVQPIIGNYTVGTLPAGGVSGTLGYVTDGSTTSDCVTGGGSNKVLCAYTGSAWAFPGGASGGGGGGSSPLYGAWSAMPACSTSPFWYTTSDWLLTYYCNGSSVLNAFYAGQQVTPPGPLSGFTIVTGYSNPTQDKDGIEFSTVLGETSPIGIASSTTFGATSVVEAAFQLASDSGTGCGPALLVSGANYYSAQLGYSGYGASLSLNRVVGGALSNLWSTNLALSSGLLRVRLRGTIANNVIFELSIDNGTTWKDVWGMGAQSYSAVSAAGTVKAGFVCTGQDSAATLIDFKVTP